MSMMEKAMYLKGLCDGLEPDKTTKEGKLIAALLDMVTEMAAEMDDMQAEICELKDYCEELDEDLGDVEEVLLDLDDEDEDDYDFDDDAALTRTMTTSSARMRMRTSTSRSSAPLAATSSTSIPPSTPRISAAPTAARSSSASWRRTTSRPWTALRPPTRSNPV